MKKNSQKCEPLAQWFYFKSAQKCKKNCCILEKMMWGSFSPALSEGSGGFASLRSGATRGSGSVVGWGLGCFSSPGCTSLAAQSWGVGSWCLCGPACCDWHPARARKLFPLLTQGGLKFWVCSCVIVKKDQWNRIMPLPSKRRSLWGQFSVLQTQAAGQPCHNFFCIFRCMRKGQVSLKFCLSMSQTFLFKYEPWDFCSTFSAGQQQWLFYCITQAQSGISGVSSWMRKQNSSVK